MHDALIKAIAGALAGSVLTWFGMSMTLIGRVDAIEKNMGTISADVRTILLRSSVLHAPGANK